ncbi:Na+/H+ antiporter NhaA [Caulobacter segnis]|uniref:Na(+)/H(+) antiporter NhaA n=2 Tax=Caulobacter segnis TaxID=88688 RepID=D5VJA4_CAUST|nr:Na+/H+ antiporter NhaA [Caulobacter segnis]ADG10313.1 Na+/H+ antiporter NhaA [Caulobacter segnis ATCC 21756]AVQ02047.1 Na+/H+ antiporter NhaA [Caulobacter segnis]
MTPFQPGRARPLSALRAFLQHEASGGYVLMVAAALALIIANTPLAGVYFSFLGHHLGFSLGPVSLDESVLHWINDGLMAVFFLLVGLEIKREVLDGQLSRPSRIILPGMAALGGVAAPALIYLIFNAANPDTRSGWAIPSATDIAFALGVLALLGPRVPTSLKIFLTAIAIMDDLAAIVIIAIFYTAELHLGALAVSAGILAVLILLNRFGVKALWPYLLGGLLLWFFVLESGVHATLAGVALAMVIPLRKSPACPDDVTSPLHRLEHVLHKPVAFVIVPLFGFANAGLSFTGVSLSSLMDPVPLGVALGLFVGKQLGVFLTAWTIVRLGWADMPKYASTGQLYGVAVLCGIGFTMSLFIGNLAFRQAYLVDETKIGVLVGSLASALLGLLILRVSKSDVPESDEPQPAALADDVQMNLR